MEEFSSSSLGILQICSGGEVAEIRERRKSKRQKGDKEVNAVGVLLDQRKTDSGKLKF